jgi:hypothetical protein
MRGKWQYRQHTIPLTDRIDCPFYFALLRLPRHLLIIADDLLGQCNELRECAKDGLKNIVSTLYNAIEDGWGNITYEEGRKSAFSSVRCGFY